MKLPVLYVCAGAACKRDKANRKLVRKKAKGHARIVAVGCQDLCRGPVVGCEVEGELQWFKEVDSKKSRRALIRLLDGGTLRSSLAKRHAKKLSGRKPK